MGKRNDKWSVADSTQVSFIDPMLCLAVNKLPEGPAWQYELKLDGYRGIGVKTKGRAHLFSRNGKDFSRRFASIARALERSVGPRLLLVAFHFSAEIR